MVEVRKLVYEFPTPIAELWRHSRGQMIELAP